MEEYNIHSPTFSLFLSSSTSSSSSSSLLSLLSFSFSLYLRLLMATLSSFVMVLVSKTGSNTTLVPSQQPSNEGFLTHYITTLPTYPVNLSFLVKLDETNYLIWFVSFLMKVLSIHYGIEQIVLSKTGSTLLVYLKHLIGKSTTCEYGLALANVTVYGC